MYRLILVLCLLSSPLMAQSLPPLADDEGYCLIAIDVRTKIIEIDLMHSDNNSNYDVLNGLAVGINYRLVKMPADSYSWGNVTLLNWMGRLARIDLEDDNFEFDIKPGVLNYPGHLIVERLTRSRYSIRFTNRTTQAMQYIREERAPFSAVPFHFSRGYPDDYPEFLDSLLKTHAPKEDVKAPASTEAAADLENDA